MSKPSMGRTNPLWLLFLITMCSTVGMHMFVPSLPDVARDFGASLAATQMTISLYALGLGVGQLVYGPLSDGLGRRPMLILGLAIFVVAGIAAGLAPSLITLNVARFFQALGAAAAWTLGRAIVRESSKREEEALESLALLNLMQMAAVGVEPTIGSAITLNFGWRSVFIVLTALGVFALACTWRLLQETGQPCGRVTFMSPVRDYRVLLRSPSFVGFAFGGGCATTSIYAFYAAAPFIFAEQLHRPAYELGPSLASLVVGMALGNYFARRFVRKAGIDKVLIAGNALSILSAAALLAVVLLGELSITLMIGLMFLFCAGVGAASPAALTKSLGVNSRLVGSAAGMYGVAQMVVGGLCTSMVGVGSNPALAVAAVLTASTLIGQVGFLVALAKERAGAQPRAAGGSV